MFKIDFWLPENLHLEEQNGYLIFTLKTNESIVDTSDTDLEIQSIGKNKDWLIIKGRIEL